MEDPGWYVCYRLPIFTIDVSTEASRIEARISEGEAKRSKRDNLEYLLAKKITSVHYPMQELELNYPTTKGKVYSEEEDRYLLCRLWHYGMHSTKFSSFCHRWVHVSSFHSITNLATVRSRF